MTKLKFLATATILSMLIATPVLARGSGTRTQANEIGGHEVTAPPWSAACMTDHGPSECGEPMWVYGSRGARGMGNAYGNPPVGEADAVQ